MHGSLLCVFTKSWKKTDKDYLLDRSRICLQGSSDFHLRKIITIENNLSRGGAGGRGEGGGGGNALKILAKLSLLTYHHLVKLTLVRGSHPGHIGKQVYW